MSTIAQSFCKAVLGLVIVTATLALVVVVATQPIDGSSEVTASERSHAGRDLPDWNYALTSPVVVSNSAEAAAYLSFRPIIPNTTGSLVRVTVSNAHRDHAGKVVAWVYRDPNADPYLVIESISQWNQARLESLAGCNHKTGCEGEWTMVGIRNGTRALRITGGPTTVLIWLEGGVTFELIGPRMTLSVPEAMAIANQV